MGVVFVLWVAGSLFTDGFIDDAPWYSPFMWPMLLGEEVRKRLDR